MAEPEIEHVIPSKQRHYVGTWQQLQANLIRREIGLCSDANDQEHGGKCYYKGLDDELHPLGGGGFDKTPQELSLLMGQEDGSYDFSALVKQKVGTGETQSEDDMWYTLGGIKFVAERAYRDSEGNLLKQLQDGIGIHINEDAEINLTERNQYVSPRVQPTLGAITLTQVESAHTITVNIGSRAANSPLGALVPYTDRGGGSDPIELGDVLQVTSFAGGPNVRWAKLVKTLNEAVTLDSEYEYLYKDHAVASQVAAKLWTFLDPNQYNSSESYIGYSHPEAADLTFKEGWYYVIDNELYVCTQGTPTTANLRKVKGVVTALNDINQRMRVEVLTFDLAENKMYDKSGNLVSGQDCVALASAGFVPVVFTVLSYGGVPTGLATPVSLSSQVTFRTPPDIYGRFTEISGSFYSSTWTNTGKTLPLVPDYAAGNVNQVLSVVNNNGALSAQWADPPSTSEFELHHIDLGGGGNIIGNYTLDIQSGSGWHFVVGDGVTSSSAVATISTQSTSTVRSIYVFSGNTASANCSYLTLRWKDETLNDREITIDFCKLDGNIFAFEIWARKITVNGQTYTVARVLDYPVNDRSEDYGYYGNVGCIGYTNQT